MITQLRSELLKLVTVRTTGIFAGATALLIAAVVLLQAGTAGGELLGPLDEVATQRALFTTAGVAPIIAIVFGALVLTTELRHHTIVPTLLVTADRLRVVAAKAGATLAVGATLGTVAVLAAVGTASLVLTVTSTPIAVSVGDLAGPAAGTIAAAGLGALFGLGVGGMVRNQALAVGAVLILLLAIEPLAASFLPDLAVWLPSSLTTALAEASAPAEHSLGLVTLALAGYGLVTTAVAALGLRREDIT